MSSVCRGKFLEAEQHQHQIGATPIAAEYLRLTQNAEFEETPTEAHGQMIGLGTHRVKHLQGVEETETNRHGSGGRPIPSASMEPDLS